MKHKELLSYDNVANLKIEVKKTQWHIEDQLSVVIETLENVIDIKDKEIDELNKKIEKLEKPKKTVKHRFFYCSEVEFRRVTSEQFAISTDVYLSPEEYRNYKQGIVDINGNEFYLGTGEAIKGRIKAKMISYSCYSLEEAQEIAKDLLSNDICGNIKA